MKKTILKATIVVSWVILLIFVVLAQHTLGAYNAEVAINNFLPMVQGGQTVLTIERGIDLLLPRTLHTSTRLLDGKVLIIGGSQAADQHLTSTEIFDPETELINFAGELHTPRHDHSATLLNDGRVLVVGGYNYSSGWLGDAEVYDPYTDNWTVISPNYSHGVNHTATLMKDGRVLVVGGCIGGGLCTNTVEIFFPATDTWLEVQPLMLDRSSHNAVLLENGNVLIVGGSSIVDASNDSQAWLYEPGTNQWKPAGVLSQPRIFAQAVLLHDGRVLVTGGGYNNTLHVFEPLASTEVYDPVTNFWSSEAKLEEARLFFSMVILSDGRILVVGGARDPDNSWTEQSFVSEIEMYDPAYDNWRIVEELDDPVAHPTAFQLLDGRVWVTGGQSGYANGAYHKQTWLLTPNSIPPIR